MNIQVVRGYGHIKFILLTLRHQLTFYTDLTSCGISDIKYFSTYAMDGSVIFCNPKLFLRLIVLFRSKVQSVKLEYLPYNKIHKLRIWPHCALTCLVCPSQIIQIIYLHNISRIVFIAFIWQTYWIFIITWMQFMMINFSEFLLNCRLTRTGTVDDFTRILWAETYTVRCGYIGYICWDGAYCKDFVRLCGPGGNIEDSSVYHTIHGTIQ